MKALRCRRVTKWLKRLESLQRKLILLGWDETEFIVAFQDGERLGLMRTDVELSAVELAVLNDAYFLLSLSPGNWKDVGRMVL